MLSSAIKTQGNKTPLISLLTQKRSKTKILLLPKQNNSGNGETLFSLPILSRVGKHLTYKKYFYVIVNICAERNKTNGNQQAKTN